jgi:TolB protein
MRPTSVVLGLVVTLAAGPVLAQQPPPDDLPRIRFDTPDRNLLRVAAPNAVGDGQLARQATDFERRDLQIVGLFQVLDPAAFPPDLQNEGLNFSSALWSQVAAQAVTKMRVTRDGGGVMVEGRLYKVGTSDSPLVTKTYRGPDLRGLVHQWVNEVISQFSGVRGVFGSRIVFAQTGGSTEVASVGMDGGDMTVLTKMKSECILPAYSPTGREIVFTSYLFGGADLWLVSSAGGRARRISSHPGMNSGATWYRDGSRIALTLSHEGNPELYQMHVAGGSLLRLTRAPASDLSPSLSPDQSQIAFVSDRQGSPQIFVMPASGGNPKRLTFQGNQNTTPQWNPAPDKPLIAFTGRDERATFDIFILDMRTQKVDRVTQNQGSNYDPSWSPDGRLLVYASNRGGLFVRNPETRIETQISRGGARNPSWGPPPVNR